MSRTARRQHHDRLGALALVAVSLLIAAAQQPLSAAEKTRRVNATPPAPVAPPAAAPAPAPPAGGAPDTAGYWMVGVDAGITAYVAAPSRDRTGRFSPTNRWLGMAPPPSGQ